MHVKTDGQKVRALREAHEPNARVFAREAGISQRTLTRVERNEGPVRTGTARKIGAALGVDPRTFARAISRRHRRAVANEPGRGILRGVPAPVFAGRGGC